MPQGHKLPFGAEDLRGQFGPAPIAECVSFKLGDLVLERLDEFFVSVYDSIEECMHDRTRALTLDWREKACDPTLKVCSIMNREHPSGSNETRNLQRFEVAAVSAKGVHDREEVPLVLFEFWPLARPGRVFNGESVQAQLFADCRDVGRTSRSLIEDCPNETIPFGEDVGDVSDVFDPRPFGVLEPDSSNHRPKRKGSVGCMGQLRDVDVLGWRVHDGRQRQASRRPGPSFPSLGFRLPAMFLRRLAVPLSLSLALIGCSKTSGSGGEQDTSTDERVVIVDVGSKPRKVLRYEIKEGSRATSRMTMGFDMSMAMGDQQMPDQQIPPMVSTISTLVTDVSNDRITFEMTYDSFSIKDGPAHSQEIVSALRQAVKGISGMGGTFVMNDRGVVLEGSVDVPEGVDPTFAQMLDQVSAQTEQLATPFPAQPIGEGASWVVTNETEVGGFTTDTTTTYTLLSRSQDTFELEVEMEQSAKPQNISMPGMPAGATAEILKLEGSGEGTTRGSTSMLLPSATMASSSNVRMKITTEGETTLMTQGMDITVSMKTLAA